MDALAEPIDAPAPHHVGVGPRRVLVTGSREWADSTAIRDALLTAQAAVVIEGGARGADTIARTEGRALGLAVETYPADWSKFGRLAGGIRNQLMLDDGKPDLVLAFPLPGSIGTYDMVRRARKAGVPVTIYDGGERPARVGGGQPTGV